MNGLFLVDPVMGHAAAASVAVLFLLAALSKLRDIELFHAVLDNYQLLPSALVPVAARVLPTLELAAGVLLLPLVSRLAFVCGLAVAQQCRRYGHSSGIAEPQLASYRMA